MPDIRDATTVTVTDGSLDAVTWACALRPRLAELGMEWTDLDTDTAALALASAAGLWRQTLQGRPKRSALDAAPHLSAEFLRNETRPGIELAWLPPSAKDKCWWRCQQCGHEWRTSVEVRAYLGSGCPKCGRVEVGRASSLAQTGHSLADLHADIVAEFVACVRPDLTPADLRPSSNLQCFWKCPKCAHKYKAPPAARVRGRGCPVCASSTAGDTRNRREAADGNSLAELFPALTAELVELKDHPHRGVTDIPPGSNHQARWRCSECGHVWSATVASRALAGAGCPACGRLRTAQARSAPASGQALADLLPRIASELVENLTHPGRGADQLKSGSHDRCRWQCAAGHEWVTMIKNRTRGGTGCPTCHRLRAGTK